jgi:hypothetical protein
VYIVTSCCELPINKPQNYCSSFAGISSSVPGVNSYKVSPCFHVYVLNSVLIVGASLTVFAFMYEIYVEFLRDSVTVD